MGRNGKSDQNELQVRRVLDVPLREVSGICLRRSRNGRMSLIAVGDRIAKIAWFSLSRSDGARIDWHTKSIAKLSGSELPKHDPQIEAVCADGGGRVLLLQETPPRVELIDTKALETVASIDLVVEGRGEIARAWSDPKGSRGEGVVMLPGGHLLVAKEKKPAALLEFGPPDSRSRGLARGGALPDGARDVLVLHAIYGYSHGETARRRETMGLPVGNARAPQTFEHAVREGGRQRRQCARRQFLRAQLEQ